MRISTNASLLNLSNRFPWCAVSWVEEFFIKSTLRVRVSSEGAVKIFCNCVSLLLTFKSHVINKTESKRNRKTKKLVREILIWSWLNSIQWQFLPFLNSLLAVMRATYVCCRMKYNFRHNGSCLLEISDEMESWTYWKSWIGAIEWITVLNIIEAKSFQISILPKLVEYTFFL